MTAHDLESIASDTALIVAALDAGEYGAARAIANTLTEYLDALRAYKEADAISPAQLRYLSALTGDPESEFQAVTRYTARGAIADLVGFGETNIGGRTYIRTLEAKPRKRTTADRKRARGGKFAQAHTR